jgi:hypothetical protein
LVSVWVLHEWCTYGRSREGVLARQLSWRKQSNASACVRAVNGPPPWVHPMLNGAAAVKSAEPCIAWCTVRSGGCG